MGLSPYSYNSSNELTALPSGSYTYDDNSNTKMKPDGTQYTWDFDNRLTQVVLPASGGTVNFKYDPYGRRIQKAFTQNGTTTTANYLYDGMNVLEEMDSAGNVLARYSQPHRGMDEPLAELRSGTTGFYQADALGTITSLSNSTGAVAGTYTYDSFGKLTASTGTITNPFQYTAREFDPETGIYFYRARYYDQSTGRFLNEDPIGFGSGANFYAYVRNDPVRWRDADGRKTDWGGVYDTWKNAKSGQDWFNCFARMGYCMKGLQNTSQSLDGMNIDAEVNTQQADVDRGHTNNNSSNQRINQCLRFDENCAKGIEDCLKQIDLTPF